MGNKGKTKEKYQKPSIYFYEKKYSDIILASGGEYSIYELADGVMDDFFGD